MILQFLMVIHLVFGIGPINPPIFVNPYDPALGGINCESPCNRFANGMEVVPELYGSVAACNPRDMGCYISFENDYGSAGPFLCVDTGGMLLYPRPSIRHETWVQYIDILHPLTEESFEHWPWWNHALFRDYTVEC